MPGTALLRVSKLSKRYGALAALDGVSFELGPGEIAGLVGPNGAGKTTTFKCIMGLARPSGGEVHVDGLPHTDPAARLRLALVPEVPYVYDLLTVWEHMQFVALAYSLEDWRERAAGLLARFGLAERRDDLASNLSKGMKQKLLVCGALLHDPAILLFDEPFVGLDPAAQRELRQAIEEFQAGGHAILISSHMLDTVERLCQRALILHRGRIIAQGSLEELRARYRLASDVPLENVFFEATEGHRDETAGGLPAETHARRPSPGGDGPR